MSTKGDIWYSKQIEFDPDRYRDRNDKTHVFSFNQLVYLKSAGITTQTKKHIFAPHYCCKTAKSFNNEPVSFPEISAKKEKQCS